MKLLHLMIRRMPGFKYGSVAFKEARIILECKKVYASPIREDGFTDESLNSKTYPKKDYHMMYVGEIMNIFIK